MSDARMNRPAYCEVQQLLLAARSLADAAEAHGTLAGCLCGVAGYRFEDWMNEILPVASADPVVVGGLRALYEATAAALLQPDMEFDLLLPEDAQPLAARTTALAEWCQGFLYGLGTGSIADAPGLPGDAGEIVRDFAEITRAGVAAGEEQDSDESAYTELVEFVRVGVQLLFEELAAARRAPPAAAAAPLH
jgi:uncharacterized protein YgfB (UPF0149 family)